MMIICVVKSFGWDTHDALLSHMYILDLCCFPSVDLLVFFFFLALESV